MARSRRFPIYKDKGFRKKDYWKNIRRVSKYYLKLKYSIDAYSGDYDVIHNHWIDIPNPKTVINDYNYRDYICTPYSYWRDEEWKKEWIEKNSRK